ncbi:MAG: hypothetical protein K2J04_01695 [Lachnospiraceae bacterium]|nr:hypothetical protein [Lachnospiraceae bacterium]
MMLRQSIWVGLLILLMTAPLSMETEAKEEMQKDLKEYVITKGYCGMEDLGEMDYYLFCSTQLHKRGTGDGITFKQSIISSETNTIEEAKELYQEFIKRLPIDSDSVEEDEEGEFTYVSYVSPDCKYIKTSRWSEFQRILTQVLFYEKEKVKETVFDLQSRDCAFSSILIVKDGDSYREMGEEHYKKLSELREESVHNEEWYPLWEINKEGSLLAETRSKYTLLTIRKIEDGSELWSFSLQGIREEVEQIRDDVQEGDTIIVDFCQFEGNESEGWLTVQAGDSSFFRIAYPSGEVTYLGEYMYAVSFSPDGKYAAYSSEEDYDSGVGMAPEEYERMRRICPPGICVREIETGKTAFIYWYPFRNPEEDFMEYRGFSWIEKESFEEFMGE